LKKKSNLKTKKVPKASLWHSFGIIAIYIMGVFKAFSQVQVL